MLVEGHLVDSTLGAVLDVRDSPRLPAKCTSFDLNAFHALEWPPQVVQADIVSVLLGHTDANAVQHESFIVKEALDKLHRRHFPDDPPIQRRRIVLHNRPFFVRELHAQHRGSLLASFSGPTCALRVEGALLGETARTRTLPVKCDHHGFKIEIGNSRLHRVVCREAVVPENVMELLPIEVPGDMFFGDPPPRCWIPVPLLGDTEVRKTLQRIDPGVAATMRMEKLPCGITKTETDTRHKRHDENRNHDDDGLRVARFTLVPRQRTGQTQETNAVIHARLLFRAWKMSASKRFFQGTREGPE